MLYPKNFATFDLLFMTLPLSLQIGIDSVTTPFRKSRWLLEMSGNVSSGTVRSDTASASGFDADYAIRLSGSKFVRDRLGVGLLLQGNRDNALRDEREAESIFIGPLVTYYFSNSPSGSVFLQGAPGYVRYREEGIVDLGVNEVVKGQGVGIFSTIGYSIVIKDMIGFDLGFTFLTSWLWGDRIIDNPPATSSENFVVSDYAFSFGFKVIL